MGKIGSHMNNMWAFRMQWKGGTTLNNSKIREVVELFAKEAERVYGDKLKKVILYGSCARGDFDEQSDIDIMLLLDIKPEQISEERNKIFSVADYFDLNYDVVLSPVVQSISVFNKYMPASVFYQNIAREGVLVAG